MKLEVIVKDLLTMPKEYVIAHNIDAHEVALGAGVAKALADKFPDLRKKCQEYANENFNAVGLVYRYTNGEYVVYNMYTKAHVWYNAMNKMTVEEYLENAKTCLNLLKEEMIRNNEKYLAIPKIGCGLDRCRWADMEDLIRLVFEDTDIEITVCML